MLCNFKTLSIFGENNLFARMGYSDCAVMWIELLMIACTFAIVIILIVMAANRMSIWIEWFYLKFSTKRASSKSVAAPGDDSPE